MIIPTTVIPKRELAAYRADAKGSIFAQIRERFSRLKNIGFTQKEFGYRIDMDEGQLSRLLRGHADLRLETLSDLARGLECRIDIQLTTLESADAEAVPIIPIEAVTPDANQASINDIRNWLSAKPKAPEIEPIAANQNDPGLQTWKNNTSHNNWAAFR